jgi:uncharacterized protein (TIGR00251 family)
VADEIELLSRGESVGLRVRVKPKSHKTEVIGVHEGALVVALAAPPHEGRANTELVRLIAQLAKVPPSRVEIASGAAARIKLVRIHGIDAAALRASLLSR